MECGLGPAAVVPARLCLTSDRGTWCGGGLELFQGRGSGSGRSANRRTCCRHSPGNLGHKGGAVGQSRSANRRTGAATRRCGSEAAPQIGERDAATRSMGIISPTSSSLWFSFWEGCGYAKKPSQEMLAEVVGKPKTLRQKQPYWKWFGVRHHGTKPR